MSSPTGVIHDIGYQRYDGAKLGRGYVYNALYVQGLRTAFGLGRGVKAKIFPWFVVAVTTIVAVVLMAIRAQTGQQVLTYEAFPEQLAPLLVLMVAIVAPELVSRDLHSNVLPLYFSRPLRSADYALARLAALVSAIVIVVGGGQLIMFIGAAFTVGAFGDVMNELGDLLLGWVYTGITALVFASLAIIVASLMKRRAVAAGAVVAVFLITTPIVGLMAVLPTEDANRLAGLFSPITLVGGVGDWVFGEGRDGLMGVGPYGPVYLLVTLVLIVGCTALLLLRYRKASQS